MWSNTPLAANCQLPTFHTFAAHQTISKMCSFIIWHLIDVNVADFCVLSFASFVSVSNSGDCQLKHLCCDNISYSILIQQSTATYYGHHNHLFRDGCDVKVDPHPLSQDGFCLTLKELHPKQLSNLPVLWALASTS